MFSSLGKIKDEDSRGTLLGYRAMNSAGKLSLVGISRTYQVHDLHKAEGEVDSDGLSVVTHGPLQGDVVFHQVLQQLPLVGASFGVWKPRVEQDIKIQDLGRCFSCFRCPSLC